MPELPEVETIRRDLTECILHQPIISLHIIFAKTVHNPVAFFKKSLINKKFLAVMRRGKLIILEIVGGNFLLIHLKMTGQLIYRDRNSRIAGGHGLNEVGVLPNRHTRLWLEFKKGGRLFFNDMRKFGYIKVVNRKELDEILQNNYGPEPLTTEFNIASLAATLKNKKVKIKALLLDQKRIAGLGNIYVDEVLWESGIAPNRLSEKIKPEEIKKLWRVINKVITKAIKYRGTTFNNYVDSHGRQGNFSAFLNVYGRDGEKCKRCGGIIKKQKIAGRGTHYCPNCQK